MRNPSNETPIPPWLGRLLKCPQCGHPDLDRLAQSLACGGCGVTYPVCNNVAMMLRPDSMTDVASEIGRHLGGVDLDAIQSALGTALRYRMNDQTLRDEFTQIVERYAAIFPQFSTDGSVSAGERPGVPGRVVLKTEYYNKHFLPGETTFRSFRVVNAGGETVATVGDRPFHLSYWLKDEAGTLIEGVRSRFPVPLEPDRELTVPLRIVAPATEGRYQITVMLVQEYVGWHRTDPVFIGDMVVAPLKPAEPVLFEAPHAGFFDFQQDLARCGEMLKIAVDMSREPSGRQLNVLEVACGNDPQTLRHYQAGTNVVACDLAFPQIQFGALTYSKRGVVPAGQYAFVAADVFNMPFPSGSFDLVVVCAALHHFVDVVEALQQLRKMLAPKGKLLLMREPGKVAPEDPTYISELANGFNEQQFVVAEYVTMFERAGLKVCHHRMDFECSYKVILEKADT